MSFMSVIFLMLANGIPLLGVLLWNWNIVDILWLYWIQSVIIGLFSYIKMRKATGEVADPYNEKEYHLKITDNYKKESVIPLFLFLYGIFLFIFLVFLMTITGVIVKGENASNEIFIRLWDIISTISFGIGGMIANHTFSFFYNFIYRNEWKTARMSVLFNQPFSRIFIMHFAIFFGFVAFVFDIQHLSIALVVFILLKTLVDVHEHRKEHKKLALLQQNA